jgi:hypothetical protein
MSLIKDNDRVLPQLWIHQALSEKHAIRHVLNDCLGRRAIFKPNAVPNLLA